MQNGESFFGEKPQKISHGLNVAPKIIPGPKDLLEVWIQCPNGFKIVIGSFNIVNQKKNNTFVQDSSFELQIIM